MAHRLYLDCMWSYNDQLFYLFALFQSSLDDTKMFSSPQKHVISFFIFFSVRLLGAIKHLKQNNAENIL